MAIETLYQGSKDVFLAKVRAAFDAFEDQALKSSRAIENYSLVGSDPNGMTLFTTVSNVTEEGDRAVWRDISVTGVQDLGTRRAGGIYPEAQFLRGWETAVFDPDSQLAGRFVVPEERTAKEAIQYKRILDRAQKLLYKINRYNMSDPWEVFNQAFSLPSVYPTRFFAKGNAGLDGQMIALNERLISTQHALANGGATVSNAVLTSGNAATFSDPTYWQAKELGGTFTDDVGDVMPMFGGRLTIAIPNANGLVRSAKEIDNSDWKVQTANNEINVLENGFMSIKSTPYLQKSQYVSGITNTNQWFLVDDSVRDPQTGTGFVRITFVPLSSRVEEAKSVDSVVYKVKEEYVYGWVDWRNAIGSPGTGLPYTG